MVLMKTSRNDTSIQFIKGINETVIPEIRIKRDNNRIKGKAIFVFDCPKTLLEKDISQINCMVMQDNEGEIITREVNIRLSNSGQQSIEAIYTWRSEVDFQRFMRFATNYATEYGLGYKES